MPITEHHRLLDQCFNLAALNVGGKFEFEDHETLVLKATQELNALKKSGRW